MTRDEFLKLKRAAFFVARKFQFEEYADDFVGELWMRQSKNPRANTTQLFIDFLRDLFGRSRIKGKKDFKDPTRVGLLPLDAVEHEPWGMPKHMDTAVLLRGLSERERVMTVLYFKWGMTEAEIGDVFGLSESGACLVLKKAKEYLIEKVQSSSKKSSPPVKS